MKKTTLILTSAICASFASAESVLKPLNDKGYGTVSGRIQSLTMYRDFESAAGGAGANGANSTIGTTCRFLKCTYQPSLLILTSQSAFL